MPSHKGVRPVPAEEVIEEEPESFMQEQVIDVSKFQLNLRRV